MWILWDHISTISLAFFAFCNPLNPSVQFTLHSYVTLQFQITEQKAFGIQGEEFSFKLKGKAFFKKCWEWGREKNGRGERMVNNFWWRLHLTSPWVSDVILFLPFHLFRSSYFSLILSSVSLSLSLIHLHLFFPLIFSILFSIEFPPSFSIFFTLEWSSLLPLLFFPKNRKEFSKFKSTI